MGLSVSPLALKQLLLLEKNRALESENTDYKLRVQNANAQIDELMVQGGAEL